MANALIQQRKFESARRLIREALADEELPEDQREAFTEFLSATYAREIEELTEKRGAQVLVQYPQGEPEASPRPAEVVYVQEDGSSIRTRTEGWRECRLALTFRASARVEGTERTEILHKKLVAQIESAEAFAQRVTELLTRTGALDASTVVWRGDGAPWGWEHQQLICPQALGILDCSHAGQHLWNVAKARLGPDSQPGAEWQAAKEQQLLAGQVEAVIAELETMRGKGAKRAWAEAEYFRKNQERRRYQEYRAQGYSIGSGAVERANAGAVQRRMRQPGMRWSVSDANKVLAIRMVYLSEDWDNVNWAHKKAA